MAIDVTLYAVSDDPADSNLYPVQASIVNGRAQLYTTLVVNQLVDVTPSDVCYGGGGLVDLAPGVSVSYDPLSCYTSNEDLSRSFVADFIAYDINPVGGTITYATARVADTSNYMTWHDRHFSSAYGPLNSNPSTIKAKLPVGAKPTATIQAYLSNAANFNVYIYMNVWGHYV